MDVWDFNPGDVVQDRYQVVRRIGHGGTSDVYEARDAELGINVALKILNHSRLKDPEAKARFHREAQVQEMLRHANIATLYGDGVTTKGQPFLAVELFPGRCLRTVLNDEHRVNVLRACSYCWQALHGLSACHAAGVMHRDLKPDNMMLKPQLGPVERVMLIDFGFASLQGESALTAQGFVVGSLSYLAPERLRAQPGDARSDVYAIGTLFYELLVGDPPFLGETDVDVAQKQLRDPPVPVRQAAPDVAIPAELENVIMRALAKDAVQRAQSALDMAAEVEYAARFVDLSRCRLD